MESYKSNHCCGIRVVCPLEMELQVEYRKLKQNRNIYIPSSCTIIWYTSQGRLIYVYTDILRVGLWHLSSK